MGRPQLWQQRLSVRHCSSMCRRTEWNDALRPCEPIIPFHLFAGKEHANPPADVAENKDRIEAANKHIIILDEESWKV